MATDYLGRLGIHALGNEALKFGIDRVILRTDDMPRHTAVRASAAAASAMAPYAHSHSRHRKTGTPTGTAHQMGAHAKGPLQWALS